MWLVGGWADKQRKIEKELKEINAKWADQTFTFQDWKGRGINILKGALSATTDDGCTDLPLPRQPASLLLDCSATFFTHKPSSRVVVLTATGACAGLQARSA